MLKHHTSHLLWSHAMHTLICSVVFPPKKMQFYLLSFLFAWFPGSNTEFKEDISWGLHEIFQTLWVELWLWWVFKRLEEHTKKVSPIQRRIATEIAFAELHRNFISYFGPLPCWITFSFDHWIIIYTNYKYQPNQGLHKTWILVFMQYMQTFSNIPGNFQHPPIGSQTTFFTPGLCTWPPDSSHGTCVLNQVTW